MSDPPGVSHLPDDRRCPHCSSLDVDWGRTGLDQCNSCGGLFRQNAQDDLRHLPDGWTPGTILDIGMLRDTGLLWLVNATVFHPRGFALTLVQDADRNIVGWRLDGDGTQPWQYNREVDVDLLYGVSQAFLDLHRGRDDGG